MISSERAAFVRQAGSALPDGFRVIDEEGVFYLLDPVGDNIAHAEGVGSDLLGRWVAEANARLAQGLYREQSKDEVDLPLSWILAKLKRGDIAATERPGHLAEAVRQAKQLEVYFERESAASQRRRNLTFFASIAVVMIAWILIGMGPEPEDRLIVTPAGRVAFWIWLVVPVFALLVSALRRQIRGAGAALFSMLWLVAGASLAVAFQVVSGWFFYAL